MMNTLPTRDYHNDSVCEHGFDLRETVCVACALTDERDDLQQRIDAAMSLITAYGGKNETVAAVRRALDGPRYT